VVDYVYRIKDRRVIVAGHSLGGGLAKIAGGHSGFPSVSFSGPGSQQKKLIAGLETNLFSC
jgi:putative lipase involved disintegration of autophagic bodies